MGDQLSVVERLTDALAVAANTPGFGSDMRVWSDLAGTAQEAATLILSLQEQLARASWQPIESAPDKGEVLVWSTCEQSGQGWICVAERHRDGWLSVDDGTVDPTHWMKLPEPPARSTLSPEPLVTPEPPCPHLSDEDYAIVSQEAATLALGCDHRMRNGQCDICKGWANG